MSLKNEKSAHFYDKVKYSTNFQHYVNTRKEAYDDSSSDEYFKSPFVVYSKLADPVEANSVITFDKPDIKNEEMLDTPKLPQRKFAPTSV